MKKIKPSGVFILLARAFLILVSLAASGSSPSGAAPLFPNPVFQVGDFPEWVAIGDFDADGFQDLAVANRGAVSTATYRYDYERRVCQGITWLAEGIDAEANPQSRSAGPPGVHRASVQVRADDEAGEFSIDQKIRVVLLAHDESPDRTRDWGPSERPPRRLAADDAWLPT